MKDMKVGKVRIYERWESEENKDIWKIKVRKIEIYERYESGENKDIWKIWEWVK